MSDPAQAAAGEASSSPRCRQSSDWDCGLACAEMVAALIGRPQPGLATALAAATPGQSVWTVDVAVALCERGLVPPGGCAMYTTLAGVNPGHAALQYYTEFEADAARLPAVFARARELGVRIEERSVQLQHVCERLAAGRALYVALVDLRFMACASCEHGSHTAAARAGLASYRGHYIVLTGYESAHGGCLRFLDPANWGSGACACGPVTVSWRRGAQLALDLGVGLQLDSRPPHPHLAARHPQTRAACFRWPTSSSLARAPAPTRTCSSSSSRGSRAKGSAFAGALGALAEGFG